MQQDGRQHEFARHLRVGNLQRTAVGAMHRIAQAVRGAGLQDIMRAVEVAGVNLQPECCARWTQEQEAAEQLIIVKPRLNSLVGQRGFDGPASVRIFKHRNFRPRLMF